MAAEWVTDVIDAVERWISLTDGTSEAPTWSPVGRAVPRGDGLLVLDLRGGPSDPDTFVDPCFAGEHGPGRGPVHPVDEVRHADGVLLLREPPGLPEDSRTLWVRSKSRRIVLEKLVAGLRAAGPAPLAEAMAQKRPAGPPTSAAEAPGLLGAQAEAFRACLSPGVRLVWGPPGTGTTQVLALAIEELVRQDKRVLLVSPADAVVDDVLHAVVRRMSPQPGVAIRVGPAQREEIASDPGVQLERLAAPASRESDETCAAVEAALQEIEAIDARIDDLRAGLGEHDEPAYRAAAGRLAVEREIGELRSRLPEAEAAADTARKAALAAAAELQEALTAVAELDQVRDALEHERGAVAGLAVLEQRLQDLRAARAALVEQAPSSGRAARRRHRRDVDAADAELRRITAVATDGRRRWLDAQLEARAITGQLSQADVDRADLRVTGAEDALAAADQEYRHSRDALAGLRSAIEQAQAMGCPSEEDRRLVADADAHDRPARHAQLQELLGRQRSNAELRGPLERKHRTLVEKARAQRTNAEAEIVGDARLVATTPAGSRDHPALARGSFDIVLVDGAGAVPLAEVLLALCRATTTAVVFGGFQALGPVLENAVQDDPSPVLQRWVGSTCFSHVGIESSADAARHDGCVALTPRSRFGPRLRRLENDTLHERLRDTEELPVALIDASTLPGLAEVRPGAMSGSWWTAGAALSRALAEVHLPDGPAGVVALYRVRADVRPAALRGRDLTTGVGVGTVHFLPGRADPRTVFVLVESGHGREGDGLQIFGIGITRAHDRLYLVGDGEAVRTARVGPLHVLRDGAGRGEVQAGSAAVLLGPAGPAPWPPVGSTFREVRARLRRLVTVTGVGAGPAFGRELEGHLAAARDSVWTRAPWVADGAVVPLLRDARGRPELPSAGGTVIRSDHEHGTIVVDEQVVLVGSPMMIVIVGHAFAGLVLDGLHAEAIGTPQACGRCGATMEVRHGRGRTADLYRRCTGCRLRVPRQRTSPPRLAAVSRPGRGAP